MSDSETLLIQLDAGRTSYRPGEVIRGTVAWNLERAPLRIEVRLVWNTAGKGTQNINVVQSISLPATSQREQQSFEIAAPESPYSFSGKLVSLIWAIEAEADPGEVSARSEVVISPTGTEINLYANGEPEGS